MSSGKSTYLANKLLDGILSQQTFPSLATVYLALYTATPGAGGGGTEVSGGSYARKSVTADLTQWPAASGGVKSNANAQAFVTATGSWGVILGMAIMDAATVGNELYFGDLTASKTVGSGDTAQFNAAGIAVTET